MMLSRDVPGAVAQSRSPFRLLAPSPPVSNGLLAALTWRSGAARADALVAHASRASKLSVQERVVQHLRSIDPGPLGVLVANVGEFIHQHAENEWLEYVKTSGKSSLTKMLAADDRFQLQGKTCAQCVVLKSALMASGQTSSTTSEDTAVNYQGRSVQTPAPAIAAPAVSPLVSANELLQRVITYLSGITSGPHGTFCDTKDRVAKVIQFTKGGWLDDTGNRRSKIGSLLKSDARLELIGTGGNQLVRLRSASHTALALAAPESAASVALGITNIAGSSPSSTPVSSADAAEALHQHIYEHLSSIASGPDGPFTATTNAMAIHVEGHWLKYLASGAQCRKFTHVLAADKRLLLIGEGSKQLVRLRAPTPITVPAAASDQLSTLTGDPTAPASSACPASAACPFNVSADITAAAATAPHSVSILTPLASATPVELSHTAMATFSMALSAPPLLGKEVTHQNSNSGLTGVVKSSLQQDSLAADGNSQGAAAPRQGASRAAALGSAAATRLQQLFNMPGSLTRSEAQITAEEEESGQFYHEMALSFDDSRRPVLRPISHLAGGRGGEVSVPLAAQGASLGVPTRQDPELQSVLQLLPDSLATHVAALLRAGGSGARQLRDIIIDTDRDVELRLGDGTCCELRGVKGDLPEALRRLAEAQAGVAGRAYDKAGRWPWQQQQQQPQQPRLPTFSSDNRMALPGSLHRISCLRDRDGNIVGLTYRLGRHVPYLSDIFQDVLHKISRNVPGCNSLLVIGRPGLGKTTLLHDMARQLADDCALGRTVVVVDTSNEIAGDSPTPHWCIGRARRMMVAERDMQHEVLVEAVQNASPRVIIVDEIGNKKEVAAVRSIIQRGVSMIGTVHGSDLQSLLRNPELNGLLGGVSIATVGDERASRLKTGKVTQERSGASAFDMAIEVISQDEWRFHPRLSESIDLLMAHASASKEQPAVGNSEAGEEEDTEPGVPGGYDDDPEDYNDDTWRMASSASFGSVRRSTDSGRPHFTHSQVRWYDYPAVSRAGEAVADVGSSLQASSVTQLETAPASHDTADGAREGQEQQQQGSQQQPMQQPPQGLGSESDGPPAVHEPAMRRMLVRYDTRTAARRARAL